MTNATVTKTKGGNKMSKTPKKLKKYRIDAGMTIYSLAERMSVHPSTVSYWENDQKFPRRGKMEQLEDIFNVSWRELFDDLSEEEIKELEKRENTWFGRE
ncbi:transcriptional regulator [Bacillus phage SIOphi]|uniref:Transcriptional regulator n=2 Tax=root TaxID=1 RepID=R4JK13_9CAUD|nr:transcriptional regulator [Bacillus phage SIOphi]AGK86829.1 transcriptional regulator [Bacillus phage SIOphi]QXN70643.1 putative helix-turn-helix transcriptional regulator [Bacillus phage vB_BspH_TimeGriffin]